MPGTSTILELIQSDGSETDTSMLFSGIEWHIEKLEVYRSSRQSTIYLLLSLPDHVESNITMKRKQL